MTETKEWATPYHETVDDFRRGLASDAAMFEERTVPYRRAVLGERRATGLAREEPSEAERAAYVGCLMAGNYAYTLAAVLKVAAEKFGAETAARLACVADDILTNGDDQAWNADVMPHKHSHSTLPPHDLTNPGPCSCGMSYAQTAAAAALERAEAAVRAAEVSADA